MAQYAGWVNELKQGDKTGKAGAEVNWKSNASPIHPLRLAWEVENFLNREGDILTTDGGDTTTWIGMTRTFRQAGHYLDYGIFGCLGGGLPYANAAKLLYPDKRVALITGDGAIGFWKKGLHQCDDRHHHSQPGKHCPGRSRGV
jgi:acetolactate synthase-1/2/3 large subunit